MRIDENSLIDLIKHDLDYILNKDINELASSQYGELVCEVCKEKIYDLKAYLNRINNKINYDQTPTYTLFKFYNELAPIVVEIKTFNETRKDPSKADSSQINPIKQYFTNNSNSTAFFNTQFPILIETIKEVMLFADNDVTAEKSELDKLLQEAKTGNNKIKNILSGVRDEASKSGLAVHARIFNSQAKANKENSKSWKWWSVILAIVLIAFSTTMFFTQKKEITIQLAVYSGLIIAVLFYAITVCVKNYFGEAHNHTINRHKANCLSTYKTLIETADKENRGVILQKATEVIFSHQNTGFLKRESGSSSPSPVIEIVKDVAQTNTT